MSRKLLWSLIMTSWSLNLVAQSPVLDYAHDVIDTLTSKTMDGRGYADSSDYKAAMFISHEFERMNLQSFNGSYFQTFVLSVNTFPGDMSVKYAGKKLVPGKDFLVDAASTSLKGKFRVIPVIRENAQDTSLLAGPDALKKLKHVEGKPVMLSYQKSDWTKQQYKMLTEVLNGTNAFTTKGLIEIDTSKLTWDASQDTIPFMKIQLHGSYPLRRTKTKIDVDAKFSTNYLSRNVIAFVPGSVAPDSFIVFTAHYDHLGQMGDGTYFPGANDNASGTSMVLNLARYFSDHPSKYSVAFICFTGEELGLLGSSWFVQHPEFPLDKIKFLVNLDIVGTGDDGIKVVNATEFPKQFDQLVKLNAEKQYLKQVLPRGKAANSDHHPFYVKGVPCFFIYTLGGIGAYHDIYDMAETLPLTDYDDLFKLLIDFSGGL